MGHGRLIQKTACTTSAATVAFSIFTPSSVFRRSPHFCSGCKGHSSISFHKNSGPAFAPKYLRNRFQFLCDSRGPLGRFTRASLYDLKVPCPHSNSGKRTLAYTATKLFNDLSSDLKEFSISSSPLIFKFLPSSLKSKLRSLFFSRLSSAEHLEDLLCSTCRYSIHCHCFS